MGTWKHTLSEIDEVGRTAICAACGLTTIRISRSTKTGPGRWRCNTARFPGDKERNRRKSKARGNSDQSRYVKHKGKVCADCGFVPEHPCQLDVHHIDGDHENNDPPNLRTLCANCHRLYSKHVGLRR